MHNDQWRHAVSSATYQHKQHVTASPFKQRLYRVNSCLVGSIESSARGNNSLEVYTMPSEKNSRSKCSKNNLRIHHKLRRFCLPRKPVISCLDPTKCAKCSYVHSSQTTTTVNAYFIRFDADLVVQLR